MRAQSCPRPGKKDCLLGQPGQAGTPDVKFHILVLRLGAVVDAVKTTGGWGCDQRVTAGYGTADREFIAENDAPRWVQEITVCAPAILWMEKTLNAEGALVACVGKARPAPGPGEGKIETRGPASFGDVAVEAFLRERKIHAFTLTHARELQSPSRVST